ncbi:ZN572 protein, partial [Cisticola juncidis]|nr:ZN572 protein [Cisticola juncidis]
ERPSLGWESSQISRCNSELVVPEQLHGREKCCMCFECGKSFSWSCSLLTHLWVHRDGTPFEQGQFELEYLDSQTQV